MAASGLNPSQGKGQLSSSPSQDEASSQKRCQILVVEDSKPDVFLIREALRIAGVNADVHVVYDGEQATKFFNSSEDGKMCPDLILLDLNLPKESGEDVLRHMRKNATCRDAMVLVVTSSDSISERQAMDQLGACGYFRKPGQYSEYLKLGVMVKELLSDC
jgi:CheY-like chemotaxis protein